MTSCSTNLEHIFESYTKNSVGKYELTIIDEFQSDEKNQETYNCTPWRVSSHFCCNPQKTISPPKQSQPTPELLQMSMNTPNQKIGSQEVVNHVLDVMIS